ncbi:hypothetical protein [Bacillus paranthracis]|uniref:hypothetical protein n=1 Tax=Bacillus paranthracis TaxID=2026186 RepID=UPI003D64F99E
MQRQLVDTIFYETVYKGNTELVDTSDKKTFERLSTRAQASVDGLTQYQYHSYLDPHEFITEQYKLAICSQIDFLATNGEQAGSVVASEDVNGFSIGAYSEQGKSSQFSDPTKSYNKYSQAMKGYLEPTGLLYRGVCRHG